MKLREVFRYEAGYLLRSPSSWIYGGILFLLTLLMFQEVLEESLLAQAPEQVVWAYVRPGIFGILVTAGLFGAAAVRDVRAGMDALVYTSPVRKAELLGGRFLGALAANAAILLVIPLGLTVAHVLAARSGTEPLGPVRLAAHLQAIGVFLLPNLVVVAAILFTVGMLSRHVVPVYLAAIAVFIGTIVALNYAARIESGWIATLVDPLGLVSMERITRYWSEAERNARLLGLPGTLALNRVFWLSLAGGALALLHATFRFAHAAEGGRRRRGRAVITAPPADRARAVEVPRVAGSFGPGTVARQTLAVARHSVGELVGTRWFAVVLLACVGLTLLWGWNVGSTVFDTSTWPVTLLVAGTVLPDRVFPLVLVLIVLYAGELVWKDRDVGVAEIADAAPVGHATLLFGRFLALVALLVTIQAATMVGGLLIQTLQGYHDYEIGLYLRVVFGFTLPLYVLLGALAMTIHVVVNHKGVGHMVTIIAFLFVIGLAGEMGIRHNLLRYARTPEWTYSDMNGFGPFVEPVVWFNLYWAAWAMLLLLLAAVLRVRGRDEGIRSRLRQARVRFTGPVVRAAAVAGALILGLGGFIFYNANVLNEYRPEDERGIVQAEYEKRYGRYRDLPQPTITAAELHVDIRPDEPAVDIRGAYRLVNRTEAPIDSVHVFTSRDVETRSLALDRAAEELLADEEVGYRIFALERALDPGDSVDLAFDVAFRPRGFPNEDIQTDVVANGTSFNRMLMPFVGYQPLFELSGDEARERFGLEPRPRMPGPGEAAEHPHRWAFRDADLVHVDATISTAADQIAITPGVLQRSWTSEDGEDGGRRWFHYRTETPIAFGGTVASAEYAVVEDRWNDVALAIFHHPAHDENLDRMMRGMKESLAYLTEQFGPYPYSDLRVVEVPRYGGFGSAHPHTIAFTEDVFFSRVREGEVDQPFYGTAHEVAHAWWGGMVRGAPVRGAEFLSESLANYSAMAVTERTYGAEAGRRIYGFQMERYLRGRATQSREVPVLEVEDQPYVAYRKGALALWTLRDHIGEEAVNAALRRYFEKYHGAGPPYPTSLDLYAELRAVSPDSLHPLLEDWFETITLWDVATESAVVEPTGTGEYRVRIEVVARKTRADGVGNETEVPMDDLVEIGVFAPGGGAEPGEPLYLERHRIESGRQTIEVTVPRAPGRAGIDPYRKLIDRDRTDDVVGVQAGGG